VHIDRATGRPHGRTVDQVPKLEDIARPWLPLKPLPCPRCHVKSTGPDSGLTSLDRRLALVEHHAEVA